MVEQYGKIPALFIGHGSPMNAILVNEYTESLKKTGQSIGRPKAILVISAHWMTERSLVLADDRPKTIHDFYGFTDELYQIKYEAPGSVEWAERIADASMGLIQSSGEWGLDHGAWAVLRHLFPDASIPVLELSIDMTQEAPYHFDLGRKLAFLRQEGVLVIGSGNIVHNLRMIRWEADSPVYDWAEEFDGFVRDRLAKRDFDALMRYREKGQNALWSVPTPDHYWPLLYVLGMCDETNKIQDIYEGFQNASISMRCIQVG